MFVGLVRRSEGRGVSGWDAPRRRQIFSALFPSVLHRARSKSCTHSEKSIQKRAKKVTFVSSEVSGPMKIEAETEKIGKVTWKERYLGVAELERTNELRDAPFGWRPLKPFPTEVSGKRAVYDACLSA